MNKKDFCQLIGLPVAFSLIMLSACGGGGTKTEPPPTAVAPPPPVVVPPPVVAPTSTTVSGKVIDGYVTGATVWLDINGNNIKDDNEPSVVSEAAGDYALELNDEQLTCLPYSTLYVDVPVGAFDEDLGEVTEAYQMSVPPSIDPITDDVLLNISPLTTVIWQQLKDKLSASEQVIVSCENLIENQSLRADIQAEIANVIRNIVDHYNISAEDIYADFIANDNTKAYLVAQKIVTGLKFAYAHQITIEKQYPQAKEIRVTVYQGEIYDNNNAYPEAWYRETIVFKQNDGFFSEIVKLTDEGNAVERIIYTINTTDIDWADGKLRSRKDAVNANGPDGEFYCSNSETVIFKQNNISYTLSNDSPNTKAANIESCDNQDYGNGPWKYYSIDYQIKERVSSHTTFSVSNDDPEFANLSHWQNLKDKSNTLSSSELVDYFKLLPYHFDDEVTLGVNAWHKRITDDSTELRVQTDKYSNGTWERLAYRADNTYIKECSSDGELWKAC